MKDLSRVGCPKLDGPEVSQYLFYPRASWNSPISQDGVRDVMIPVEDGVSIGARYHIFNRQGPSILFFHGNGEIVEDYEDVAFLYSRLSLNFLPVDYRGYGHSTGQPTVSAMLRDAHVVLEYTRKWLTLNGCSGPFIVMGRSLGSASALELAEGCADLIDGLIIESGFAHSQTILNLVGVDMKRACNHRERGLPAPRENRPFHKANADHPCRARSNPPLQRRRRPLRGFGCRPEKTPQDTRRGSQQHLHGRSLRVHECRRRLRRGASLI